jgi:hypothetical protein
MAAPPIPPQWPYAPPYPAPYPYPPPWYPPPKKDESKLALIIIVVVVVVIVVPMVLAAVLYVMVSGLIGGPNEVSPSVTFTTSTACGPTCWQFSVAGISTSASLGEFRVALLVNSTSLGILPLADGPLQDDGLRRLQFVDVSSDAQLTAGDEFRLDNQGGPADCEVELFWAPNGDLLNTARWRC